MYHTFWARERKMCCTHENEWVLLDLFFQDVQSRMRTVAI